MSPRLYFRLFIICLNLAGCSFATHGSAQKIGIDNDLPAPAAASFNG